MFIKQQCFDASVLQVDGPMLQTAAAEHVGWVVVPRHVGQLAAAQPAEVGPAAGARHVVAPLRLGDRLPARAVGAAARELVDGGRSPRRRGATT